MSDTQTLVLVLAVAVFAAAMVRLLRVECDGPRRSTWTMPAWAGASAAAWGLFAAVVMPSMLAVMAGIGGFAMAAIAVIFGYFAATEYRWTGYGRG